MSTRRDIETQLRSLNEIKEIMSAMKNLALMEVHRLTRFLDTQCRVVATIEAAAADFLLFHPELFPREEESRNIHLILGTERGFCGDLMNPSCGLWIIIAVRSPNRRWLLLVASSPPSWRATFASQLL